MERKSVAENIVSQEWLDKPAEQLQNAVSRTFEAAGEASIPMRNFLHGVWQGHPLHPAITDLPLGAWTAAVAMDALDVMSGGDGLARGADTAIAIGLVGAVGAAASGLTDYHVLNETRPKRIGAMHALLNVAATGFFAASLIARGRNRRDIGRGLSLVGFGITGLSAFLGGKLVYEEHIGVDHAPSEGDLPKEWTPVIKAEKLKEGKPLKVMVHGVPICVVRQHGQIYAIADLCSHLGGPLHEGRLEGCSIRCPWHGSRFSLEDGSVQEGPSVFTQPVFETREQGEQVEIRLKSQ